MYCPAIIAMVARVRSAAALVRAAVGSSSRTSQAKPIKASPTMMASPTPNTFHMVARCRRSASSSTMSS